MADEVAEFIEKVTPERRLRDARTLLALFARVTGERPRLAYATIVGFGEYHYRYASGREGDAPAASFSPRKAATTIYLPDGVDAHRDDLGRLGPHTTGVGCLYLKDVEALDLEVLERIIRRSYTTVTGNGFGQQPEEPHG